ncbi:hypothetical protein BLOT_012757 [Blomia tropicalis]|nr:hypothetical protein BLOT_012757 [Blomia tropicalis]
MEQHGQTHEYTNVLMELMSQSLLPVDQKEFKQDKFHKMELNLKRLFNEVDASSHDCQMQTKVASCNWYANQKE